MAQRDPGELALAHLHDEGAGRELQRLVADHAPSMRTPPRSTRRSASLVEGASRPASAAAPIASGAPASATLPDLVRHAARAVDEVGSAASAAAALWKRVVISLASSTLASFGLRPAVDLGPQRGDLGLERKLSSVYQRHISVSLIDSTLANMVLAGSVMPM